MGNKTSSVFIVNLGSKFVTSPDSQDIIYQCKVMFTDLKTVFIGKYDEECENDVFFKPGSDFHMMLVMCDNEIYTYCDGTVYESKLKVHNVKCLQILEGCAKLQSIHINYNR